jgi:hypothetical protein
LDFITYPFTLEGLSLVIVSYTQKLCLKDYLIIGKNWASCCSFVGNIIVIISELIQYFRTQFQSCLITEVLYLWGGKYVACITWDFQSHINLKVKLSSGSSLASTLGNFHFALFSLPSQVMLSLKLPILYCFIVFRAAQNDPSLLYF